MLLDVKCIYKYLILFSLALGDSARADSEIKILIISSNETTTCGKYKYKPIQNLYQIDLLGKQIPAQDKFVWMSCESGSIWVPFGERLLNLGNLKKVTLAPITIDFLSEKNWQEGAVSDVKLNHFIKVINENKLRFDYIFFLVGQTSASDLIRLKENSSRLINYFRRNSIYAPWVIGQERVCKRGSEAVLSRTLDELTLGRFLKGYYRGPGSVVVNVDRIGDGCLLEESDQVLFADDWVEAYRRTTDIKDRAEKETLVKFLKLINF